MAAAYDWLLCSIMLDSLSFAWLAMLSDTKPAASNSCSRVVHGVGQVYAPPCVVYVFVYILHVCKFTDLECVASGHC